MSISKKLSFIAVLCTATTYSMGLCTEQKAQVTPPSDKAMLKIITAAIFTTPLIGSGILGQGLSNLNLAKRITKEIVRPETLRKRGLFGIAIGSVLTLPISTLIAYAGSKALENQPQASNAAPILNS